MFTDDLDESVLDIILGSERRFEFSYPFLQVSDLVVHV